MAEGIILKRRRPLLLNRFPNAAAAYSLRNLKATYVGNPVVRVRRSADNAESDFTATEVSDGTLATWVGSGNDGFVTTWYDQSGNNRNATESNASVQPKIVTGGNLITIGSKPILDFGNNNSGIRLLATVPGSIVTNSFSFFLVIKTTTENRQTALRFDDPNVFGYFPNIDQGGFQGARVFWRNTGTIQGDPSGGVDNEHLIQFFRYNHVDGLATFWRDNSFLFEVSILNDGTPSSNNFFIGGATDTNSNGANFQEVILYESDQLDARNVVTDNINSYYGIF